MSLPNQIENKNGINEVASFKINDNEWKALDGEAPEVFKIYCLIRRHMDFATGITGITFRLKDENFRDALRINSVRGRHKAVLQSDKNTRQKFRSILQRLEKIGLITIKNNHVFKCNFALMDNSAQMMNNQSATNEQPDQQPRSECSKSFKNSNKSKKENLSATASCSDESSMNNLESGISVIKENITTNVVIQKKVFFDEFYKRYPRKVSKAQAEKAWMKIKDFEQVVDLIFQDLSEREKQDSDWRRGNGYVPYPASYLNGKRWQDVEKILKPNAQKLIVPHVEQKPKAKMPEDKRVLLNENMKALQGKLTEVNQQIAKRAIDSKTGLLQIRELSAQISSIEIQLQNAG